MLALPFPRMMPWTAEAPQHAAGAQACAGGWRTEPVLCLPLTCALARPLAAQARARSSRFPSSDRSSLT